jgi:hypothetical protein
MFLRVNRVQSNIMMLQLGPDLHDTRSTPSATPTLPFEKPFRLTRSLKASRSCKVKESDLAMIGTTLVTSDNFLKTVTSIYPPQRATTIK